MTQLARPDLRILAPWGKASWVMWGKGRGVHHCAAGKQIYSTYLCEKGRVEMSEMKWGRDGLGSVDFPGREGEGLGKGREGDGEER